MAEQSSPIIPVKYHKKIRKREHLEIITTRGVSVLDKWLSSLVVYNVNRQFTLRFTVVYTALYSVMKMSFRLIIKGRSFVLRL